MVNPKWTRSRRQKDCITRAPSLNRPQDVEYCASGAVGRRHNLICIVWVCLWGRVWVGVNCCMYAKVKIKIITNKNFVLLWKFSIFKINNQFLQHTEVTHAWQHKPVAPFDFSNQNINSTLMLALCEKRTHSIGYLRQCHTQSALLCVAWKSTVDFIGSNKKDWQHTHNTHSHIIQ